MLTTEIIKPPISQITRKALRKYGYSKNAACSSGRCYEFQDVLYDMLKKYGYKPRRIESMDWARSPKSGYAEARAVENNNHAWIYVDGKHYDSLDLDGAERPSKMKFFKDQIERWLPDDEDKWDMWNFYQQVYDPVKDKFVKSKKIDKTLEV